MRVVVTGATSMIGVALIKTCIKNNDEVLAIVRKGTNRLERLPKSDLIQVEYADLDTLLEIQEENKKYDVFYHFAWGHTAKSERDYPVAQEDNIRTTLQAVELAHKLGCYKFIGAGSQAEYGQVDGIISAETRAEPITSYGMAKLAANMLSRRLCQQYKMQHIWGRIFSVYGCNDNEGTMINYAIDQFIKGETAKFSSANQMWNYLNEEDAGTMFYLLGAKNVSDGIYCIANSESKVLREYIEMLKQVFGKGAECEFAPVNEKIKPIGLQANIDKTIEAIGYHPQVKFKEGINQVINFRKSGKYE